jgi:DNA-binding NarL/FixJ family response regulator
VTSVLVVDDHENVLTLVSELLKVSCAVVGAVKDFRVVVETALETSPDVIVLDLNLGDATGLDVARWLRDAGSTAAIVMISGYDDEAVRQAALGAGAQAYVVKTRLVADLVRTVHEAAKVRLKPDAT